jgi:hypothetical protein
MTTTEGDLKVAKTDITTVLNNSSTDRRVPSAKTVYNMDLSGKIGEYLLSLPVIS